MTEWDDKLNVKCLQIVSTSIIYIFFSVFVFFWCVDVDETQTKWNRTELKRVVAEVAIFGVSKILIRNIKTNFCDPNKCNWLDKLENISNQQYICDL